MNSALRRRLSLLLASVVAVAVAVAMVDGCTIVNGLVADAPDTGAGNDAGDAGDAEDPDACKRELMPAEPVDRGTPGGAETIIVVAHDLSFGLGDGGVLLPVGYDLDGVCSCNPDPESCAPRVGRKCDDTGNGRDNGGQVLVREALGASLDLEKVANESFEQGSSAVLVRVSDYNGEANDGDVRVAYIRSEGLFDDAGTNVPPTRTAADRWTVDDTAVLDKDGIITPTATSPGYVTNYVLVAPSIKVEFPLANTTTLRLDPAGLVAKIVPMPGGGHTITDLTVVGRWPVTEAMRALGSFQPTKTSPRFCETPIIFEQLKIRACEAADIRALQGDDGKGLGCNAISAGLHAVGSPASFGKLVTVPTNSYCEDAGLECPGDAGN